MKEVLHCKFFISYTLTFDKKKKRITILFILIFSKRVKELIIFIYLDNIRQAHGNNVNSIILDESNGPSRKKITFGLYRTHSTPFSDGRELYKHEKILI